MSEIFIQSLDDPRLKPYRDLKDRDLSREGDRFIAESEQVVRRMLASDFPCESLLVARKRLGSIAPAVAGRAPIYVVPDAMMEQIIGFKFHSGVMACGVRKPPAELEEFASADRATILICPELANHENLGSLIRIAAAFGVAGIILGPRCCDPFYRLCVRVSMGAVFAVPIRHTDDLQHDMRRLRAEFGFQLCATVLDENAEKLEDAKRSDRLAIVLGNEANGLDAKDVELCDREVTIPMQCGVDSLNVTLAAGIFLYHFTRIAPASALR